ncbi:hypothetical protein A4X13_0g9518 [Tilletia indica]|uniref:Uncharacterized protein n=1 Tax=Tilletia indica TaxID=43049 RepID=A0A8T8S978_9BASI|nr:hypothetical protein A4X13_0g9518 [Tilletia indica]
MADAPPNHPDPVPGKKKSSRQQKRHIASLQRSLADQTALYEIAVQERAQAEDRAETQRRLAAVQGQAAVAATRARDEAEAGRDAAEERAAQLEEELGRVRQWNAELEQQAAQVEPLLRAVARIGDARSFWPRTSAAAAAAATRFKMSTHIARQAPIDAAPGAARGA